MKVYTLRRTQLINAPIDVLWAFFSNADNLAVLTPVYMNFRVTSDAFSDHIYPGQIITYKVSPLLHIPLFWMTEITHVARHTLFVDEQRIGPYKMWHHQHHFEQQGDKVLMTDIVHYRLPLSFIGRVAYILFIKKQLQDIFEYRRRKIEELFNAGKQV
jgi:ligand-binding SRPBCC domain-containing protein